MQCYRCGKVIPIYEVKEEVEYGPIVDIIDNPHDSGTEILAAEKRTGKKKRKKVNRLQQQDIDPDIAAEHGEINILYDSTDNY